MALKTDLRSSFKKISEAGGNPFNSVTHINGKKINRAPDPSSLRGKTADVRNIVDKTKAEFAAKQDREQNHQVHIMSKQYGMGDSGNLYKCKLPNCTHNAFIAKGDE